LGIYPDAGEERGGEGRVVTNLKIMLTYENVPYALQ